MITTHRPHPTGRDPADAILYDGCPRCDQQSRDPLRTLDADKIARLWQRVKEVELGPPFTGPAYQTGAEADAGRKLFDLYLMCERNPSVVHDIIDTAERRRRERTG